VSLTPWYGRLTAVVLLHPGKVGSLLSCCGAVVLTAGTVAAGMDQAWSAPLRMLGECCKLHVQLYSQAESCKLHMQLYSQAESCKQHRQLQSLIDQKCQLPLLSLISDLVFVLPDCTFCVNTCQESTGTAG
jgi:hypothetical protein